MLAINLHIFVPSSPKCLHVELKGSKMKCVALKSKEIAMDKILMTHVDKQERQDVF
jgi:hypothetical protein